MGLLSRRKPALLGVDISSTSVKILELSRSSGLYRVEAYAVEPLPPNSVVEKDITDVDQVGEAIGRAVRKSGSRARHAACAVAGGAVITKIITMPADISETDMEAQIELEADQYIPYPLDEISLDFEAVGPSEKEPGRMDVLLAASRSENVDVRRAVLEIAGLQARVVDVEAFALENAVAQLCLEPGDSEPGSTIAIADVGASSTTFSVLRDLKVVYTREQLFGGRQLTEDIQRRYGLSYEEAGLAKRQGGLPASYESEVLEPFKEAMAQEINRALQFFYSSSQVGAIGRILLAGGTSMTPGVAELVESKTGTRTGVANPFAGMAPPSRVRAEALAGDAPSTLIACGLALRSFD